MEPLCEADQIQDVRLSDGQTLSGKVRLRQDGWLALETTSGHLVVNPAHVVLIAPSGCVVTAGSAKGKPRTRAARSESPETRPSWTDDDLRLLANAFLDGALDPVLAQEFRRPRGEIARLRQAFESARGNVPEDLLPTSSQAWIHRWRRVLVPE